MYRAGNDIGGTFTDTVVINEETGEWTVGKVLTTPTDPSVGAMTGIGAVLEAKRVKWDTVSNVVHGTTLVANTLIERKGSKTALICTRGFRDVLEERTQKRYDLYDLLFEVPKPLVPRYLRKEITERLLADGSVLVPLNTAEARQIAEELKREGVESTAVCFLHCYRNADHEHLMKSVLEKACPGMFVTCSADVVPEIREYPRESTIVANAYTGPLFSIYLSKMDDQLAAKGVGGYLYLMLSSGGITTSGVAKLRPVYALESGPAAGAIAASFYGELKGFDSVLSYDMGGTTAKMCLIDKGQPSTTKEFEVARVHRLKAGSGLLIHLPVMDMIEIGTGGGSIAWIDKLGLLKVGPESAASEPGPACYDKGGTEPTVTDADLVLGYLSAGYFLGGKMPLNLPKARAAIEERVARPLKIGVPEAAWGMIEVVNENMINAIRVYASAKGKDFRAYTIVAFGGAGPVHAYNLAQKLGVEKVLVPLGAGVLSALGLLMAPFTFHLVRSYMSPLDRVDLGQVNQLLKDMEKEGTSLLQQAGVDPKDITLQRSCEMRYIGQRREIEVRIPSGVLSAADIPAIETAYNNEYKRLFFRTYPGYKLQCLNWRVVATGPRPKVTLKRFPSGRHTIKAALKGTRQIYFPEFKGYRDCPVYDRYKLFENARIEGPVAIEERESTVVIGPGGHAVTDEYLNLLITVGGK